MTLYQFKALDENKQYDALWNKGVFIAGRVTEEHKLLLYQLEGFYIEVKYDGDMNKIVGLRSFIIVGQLEPYLKNIPLPQFD